MSDIVEKMQRIIASYNCTADFMCEDCPCKDTANRILSEIMTPEIERLREALRPFITFVNLIDETIGDDLDELPLFTIDKNDFLDFLAAKAALEGK